MGPAIMVVGAVISAAGAVASGVAASNQADYQAQVAKQNAAFAAQKAQMQMEDANRKQVELGMRNRALMGGMEAQLGASGVSISDRGGTAMGVLESERALSKMGAWDYGKAAAADWYATRKQQWGAQAEATLQEAKSETSMYAGLLKAGGSLLGSASEMNSKYGWFGG